MLRLLVLIVPVLSQDILGLNYSFEVDYYRTFNENKCVDGLPWHVTHYESIGVPKPGEKSTTAILASRNSCASSFSIISIPNSTLEFTVYMRTETEHSGLIISVIDEINNTAVVTVYYNRRSDGFVNGWSKLKLNIEVDGLFYINLRGCSRKDEIVLIDSFQFIPNFTKNQEDIDQENADEILKFVPKMYSNLSDELDDESGSGDEDGSGDEEVSGDEEGSGDHEEPVIVPEPEPRLALWSIALISVGGITVVGLVGVGAYHFGKARGLEASEVFDVNAEPPRVYNIPRVRGVSNNSMI